MNGYEYAASTTFAAPLNAVSVSPSARMVRCGGSLLISSAFCAKTNAAAFARAALVPVHLQLLACGLALPPGVRHDRDTILETGIAGQTRASVISGRSTTKALLDARQLLDVFDI